MIETTKRQSSDPPKCGSLLIILRKNKFVSNHKKIRFFLFSATKNHEIIVKINCEISAGRKIAGIILAVLTLDTPSMLVPMRITTNEPVVDIYETTSVGTEPEINKPKSVRTP